MKKTYNLSMFYLLRFLDWIKCEWHWSQPENYEDGLASLHGYTVGQWLAGSFWLLMPKIYVELGWRKARYAKLAELAELGY